MAISRHPAPQHQRGLPQRAGRGEPAALAWFLPLPGGRARVRACSASESAPAHESAAACERGFQQRAGPDSPERHSAPSWAHQQTKRGAARRAGCGYPSQGTSPGLVPAKIILLMDGACVDRLSFCANEIMRAADESCAAPGAASGQAVGSKPLAQHIVRHCDPHDCPADAPNSPFSASFGRRSSLAQQLAAMDGTAMQALQNMSAKEQVGAISCSRRTSHQHRCSWPFPLAVHSSAVGRTITNSWEQWIGHSRHPPCPTAASASETVCPSCSASLASAGGFQQAD